jgi:hypothetical protein
MADLPMAQIPNFSLGATPNMGPPVQGAIAAGQGVSQGIQFQQELAQKKLLQQAEIHKMQVEKGSMIAKNALEAYDSYGDAAGAESFNAFKKGMNMMAPGSVDPNAQWDSGMGQALKTASGAFDAAQEGTRPWPEAIGVISKVMGAAGKNQRARMEPILHSAQDIFNQEQTTGRQESSQAQDTQRAYASHAMPFIQTGSALSTINQLLDKNTATGDAAAKTLIERNLANGSISKEDADNLTKAGSPLEKIANYWHTIGTGKLFDDTHRKAMKDWTSSKVSEINSTLRSSASAFPGAKPAFARETSKSKSGKPIFSDDGGKTWQYQ